MPSKRENYLEWQEYFMSIAFLSAQRSKDPRTQVGACIVNKGNKIVGIGYNGMPNGCSDDLMPWNRAENKSTEKWLDSKTPYVCHAELNAVLNKNSADIKGCIIYVALFPCNTCAQIIIQSGIEEVIYYSDKYHDKPEFEASRHLMDMAGVKYRQFRPRQKKIVIDFETVESSENLTNGVGGNSLESSNATTTVSSSNDELQARMSDTVASSNNNNIGKRQNFVIHNHVEQQQMMNNEVNTHLQTSPLSHSTGQRQTTSLSLSHSVVEYNFALVSLLFIGIVVLLSWYAGQK